MLLLSAIFIAVCVVLIGACLGVVAYLAVGLSLTQSAVVGFAAMTALALYNMVSARIRDHSNVGSQIADISRASADLGYAPRTPFAEGLRRFVEWSRASSAVAGVPKEATR